MRNLQAVSDRWLLLASLILQIALGLFLGHAYDDRINLATGYLVATGQNPYLGQDLTAVFQHAGFQTTDSIGYPPLWPLVLGVIYQVTYRIFPNFFLYNLAVKIPIILANVFLALVIRKILIQLGADEKRARRAWLFMLFNPFLLLTTTAWGQIDSFSALLALLALQKLADGKRGASSLLLALALTFKPIVIPLLPAAWVYLKGEPVNARLKFMGLVTVMSAVLCVLPFLLLGWNPSVILANWNAPISAGGGLSFLSMLRLVSGSTKLTGAWQFLGVLWLPALISAACVIKLPQKGRLPLFEVSAVMVLFFLIFKSWVSEPNIAALLPLILILAELGVLSRFALHLCWILPLAFSLFNMAAVQLLFPIAPTLMDRWMGWMGSVGALWQILAAITAVVWLIFAGRTARIVLRKAMPNGGMDHAD